MALGAWNFSKVMSRIMKILIVFLVVLVVVSGAVMLFVRRKAPQANPADPAALLHQVREQGGSPALPSPAVPPPAPPRPSPASAVTPAVPADPAVQLEADLAHLAAFFAERAGTFSNQQSVSGAASLAPVMTAFVQQFVAREEARLRAAHPDPAVPYTLITRARNTETSRFSAEDATAVFVVATQREEREGSTGIRRTFYQDMEVRMTNDGGTWKVSGAYWRERS